MIQNECLERDVVERDKLIEDVSEKLGVVSRDLDWLLCVGVVRVMDKLIEHHEFASGVHRICHATFIVGKKARRVGFKAEIDAGTYDPEESDSRSIHTIGLDDALVRFATLDYVYLLGLGRLDIVGLRKLCVFDDVDEMVNEGGNEVGGGIVTVFNDDAMGVVVEMMMVM